MKRSAITIAALLIFGATFSAALAWWCALRDAASSTARAAAPDSDRDFTYNDDSMHIIGWRSFGFLAIADSRMNSFGGVQFNVTGPRVLTPQQWADLVPPHSTFVSGSPLDRGDPNAHAYFHSFEEHNAGWPAFAFTSTRRQSLTMANDDEDLDVRTGVVTIPKGWLPGNLAGEIPVTPIWSGLFLDTLCYAAGAWLILLGPWRVRRLIRWRRGRCTHCGYDHRGNTSVVCPECGSLVGSQAVRRDP